VVRVGTTRTNLSNDCVPPCFFHYNSAPPPPGCKGGLSPSDTAMTSGTLLITPSIPPLLTIKQRRFSSLFCCCYTPCSFYLFSLKFCRMLHTCLRPIPPSSPDSGTWLYPLFYSCPFISEQSSIFRSIWTNAI